MTDIGEKNNLDHQHAPNLTKVECMISPTLEAQETLIRLGPYLSYATENKFQGFPTLGPYRYEGQLHTYQNGTYTGQYNEGKRHGYGTWVKFYFFLAMNFA